MRMRIRRLLVNTCIAALGGLSFAAGAADGDFDRTFLGDYTKLVATPSAQGTDHIFVAPGAIERLAKYGGVMVDQPEILISPKSDYKGAKPADLAAIAALMRQRLGERLIQGGYKVAEAPGPGVIYVRVALTDLQLKKKKRGVLGYTPIGFVVKAGTDLVKDMMGKYDIMGMVIQAEVTDSQTEEVFGAIVAERAGTEGEPLRMDFEEFAGQMQEFSSRLRCRLDNSRVPEAQRIDCLDAAARAARETAAPAPKP